MLGEPSGDPGRFFLFCARGPDMPDRSDEFRRAARECLQRARAATDEGTRLSLLIMAQRWFDLANGPPSQGVLDTAVRVFNEQQMTPNPVTQQQQQAQPKKRR
jgi:hypothetical protein